MCRILFNCAWYSLAYTSIYLEVNLGFCNALSLLVFWKLMINLQGFCIFDLDIIGSIWSLEMIGENDKQKENRFFSKLGVTFKIKNFSKMVWNQDS